MKRIFLSVFSVLLLNNCSTTQIEPEQNEKDTSIDINSLSQTQECIEDQTKGLPGKCYARFKNLNEEPVWCEVFCPSQIQEASRTARECLLELGYVLINATGYKTETGNALIEFQMENGLKYGALDEATVYFLLLATE